MKEHLPGGITMEVSEAQFRLSTDSMVLADFAAFPKNARICDLGCGCGALTLLTAVKHPTCALTGVEILPLPAKTAADNVKNNQLADRITILQADFRDRTVLEANRFDGVICNPPYYPAGSGYVSKNPALAAARSEKNCTLRELTAVCGRILRFSGRAFFVYKPERLTDLLVCLRENGLEPKRMQLVRHRADKPVSLVLMEARRGGSSGLHLEPDCILYQPDGSPSAAFSRIYHQEA